MKLRKKNYWDYKKHAPPTKVRACCNKINIELICCT
nr:MAG TPA: hypothetical protein [Caudoviricetes sp.]